MRVKTVSVLVVLFLCVSLLPMLAPQLVSPVRANPLNDLTINFTMTSLTMGNSRPVDLQTGDKVIQFRQSSPSSFVVGTNPDAAFVTGHVVWATSGDFVGTYSEVDSCLTVMCSDWGNGKGYAVGKGEFEDAHGNRIEVVTAEDLDTPTGVYGYVLSTSCTGPDFNGQVLIGTVWGSGGDVGGTKTMHLRRYSAAEVSAPIVATTSSFSGTGPSSVRNLGASGSPQDDEFVQFSRADMFVPSGTAAIYGCEAAAGSGSYSGGWTGSFAGSGDWVLVPGTTPEYQGFTVAEYSYQDSSGTLVGIGLTDDLGAWMGYGYVIILMENSTGAYAGKDYYGVMDANGSTSYYALTPPGVGVQTATGTGTATLSASSGTIQNLTAVKPPTSPAPPVNNLVFPDGMFSFDITGVSPAGSTVTVTIQLPSGIPANAAYWKYDTTHGWSQIPYTVVSANQIAITLTDGGIGDSDGIANRTITDPGGLGGPGPSGGGHSAPVFPNIYIGIGAALGAGIVAYAVRRRLAAR